MLAGAGPAPAVLFVVAADGGWMPQSSEHLAALDTLGVRHAVLAITRADLADPEPAMATARARLAETALGEVDAVAVSGRTGAGLDELRAALSGMLHAIPAADPDADVRWWIDRSFSIVGAGTVVTGTLTAGTVRAGDELLVASTGERVVVRGVESLGRWIDVASGVARVAANLRGVHRSEIRHGDALLSPRHWQLTSEVDVLIDAESLPREAALHIGSAGVGVRVRPLGPSIARLRLATPLPLRVGDRALLRDPGAHRIVTRVDVLDPVPPDLRRRGAARERAMELADLAGSDPERIAARFLRRARFVPVDAFRPLGLPIVGAPAGAGHRVDPPTWAGLIGQVPEVVAAWASAHPLGEDLPMAVLRTELDLPDAEVAAELADAAGLSVERGRVVRRAALPDVIETAIATLTAELAETPFVAPDGPRLRELGLGKAELAAAIRAGRLRKIADGVVLLPDVCERAAEIVAALDQPFTVSEVRKALGTTRRVAVPLLELLDRQGVTRRMNGVDRGYSGGDEGGGDDAT
jgi:selenocysteine-specific elongation factor